MKEKELNKLFCTTSITELDEVRFEYDRSYKKFFSYKEILAFIIKNSVIDFKEFSIEEIVALMNGEPTYAIPLLEADEIIKKKQGEEALIEKTIYYDLRFEIQSPKDKEKQNVVYLQFDIEFQQIMPTTYKIGQRAIYYLSRMISSQLSELKETLQYQSIGKVYSIWIFNPPIGKEINSGIARYTMKKEDIYSTTAFKDEDLDYLELIFIQKGTNEDTYELFELLNALVIGDIDIVKKCVNIEIEDEEMGGDDVFNQSEYIYEKGKYDGVELGRSEGIKLGRSEGRAEGRSEGIELGRTEGRAEGRSEGIELGRTEGRSEGIELGRIQTKVQSIMSLMKTMDISFEEAIVALEIDEKDILKIKERMKELILN